MESKENKPLTNAEKKTVTDRMLIISIFSRIKNARNCLDIGEIEQIIISKTIEEDWSNEVLVALLSASQAKHDQLHAEVFLKHAGKQAKSVHDLERDQIKGALQNELEKVRNGKVDKFKKQEKRDEEPES